MTRAHSRSERREKPQASIRVHPCSSVAFVLLSVVLNLGLVAAGSGQRIPDKAIDIAAYVPLDNGRTWTYQWTVQYENGQKETTTRTKSFEGPEFLATGYAYRFTSDLGDYALLSVDNGQLRLHGSVESHRQLRFTFNPPVVLYAPYMEIGRPYTVTQPADDGSGTRSWTTVVEGWEAVTTPMGQFPDCLKIRLAMDSPTAKTMATYFYARGVGLVAYHYEAWAKGKDRATIIIDAVLKLTQISGQTIRSAADVQNMKRLRTASVDDLEARKLFQQTYQRLYFWPAQFPGFHARFTLKQGTATGEQAKQVNESTGQRVNESTSSLTHLPFDPSAYSWTHTGQGVITVSPDLKMKTSGSDKQTTTQVESEMSQFITHLKDKPFDSEFKEAIITFAERDPVEGDKLNVVSGSSMGTSYRLQGGEIRQIGHSYGRVRFLVDHTEFLKTESGRLIPTRFRITYYSNETNQPIAQMDFQDEYTRVETFWLPRRRVKTEATRQGTTVLVIELMDHQLLK